MNRRTCLAALLVVNLLGYCMLSFHQTTTAAPPASLPFASSTEQRLEMLQELKEIKELLKEQNALLRSGDVKVIITQLPKLDEPAKGQAGENEQK